MWFLLEDKASSSALLCCHSKVVEDDAKPSQEVEDETSQCSHEFVIDEEQGILCKFYSFVKVEAKYIAAPFVLRIQRNLKLSKRRGRKPKEAKGKWPSLTSSIGKVSSDKCQDEAKMKKRIVHIHKGTVLKESLPVLKHSSVILQSDDFHKSLLEDVKRSYRKQSGGIQRSKSFLNLDHIVSAVTSVHPSLLPEQCYEEEEFVFHKFKLEKLRLNAEAGIKTKFFMILLKLSVAMSEKGKEVLYMDGKQDLKKRQSSIRLFDDRKSEANVLLASTRACGEGINLVGASRVVLLDVTWNPAVER
ncbi:hypothetical protein Patl1_36020 [Pistacia atlantica]|nr:hypothetical protein Patl1_36020 [Pistacia atlantica]